jgi:hypothetical protein
MPAAQNCRPIPQINQEAERAKYKSITHFLHVAKASKITG